MRRATAAAALALLAVLAVACGSRGSEDSVESLLTPPQERRPAAAFAVARLDGKGTVALADFRGRPVLVNFWASWCPPCRRETAALVAFSRAHPGIAVLGVAVNDEPADARAFARRHRIPYAVGSDPDGKLVDLYGLPGLPATFVIDAEGRLAARPWYGPIGTEDLEAFAAALSRPSGSRRTAAFPHRGQAETSAASAASAVRSPISR